MIGQVSVDFLLSRMSYCITWYLISDIFFPKEVIRPRCHMFFADWSAEEPTCHPHWLWLVLHISIHRAGRLGYSRLVSSVEAFWHANKLEMAVPENFSPPHIHQKDPQFVPNAAYASKLLLVAMVSPSYIEFRTPLGLFDYTFEHGPRGQDSHMQDLPLKCTTPLLRQAIFHRRPSYHSSGFRKVTFSQLVSCSTRFSQEDRLLVIIQSLIDFLYWELAQKRAWCWLLHVHLGQSRLLVPIPSYFHSQLKPSFWLTLAIFSRSVQWYQDDAGKL